MQNVYAEIWVDKNLQLCVSKNIDSYEQCLEGSEIMQAFRFIFKSLEENDSSILCKAISDKKISLKTLWKMPPVVYVDGPQYKLWLEQIPSPNDPALMYIDAAASCHGKYANQCKKVYIDFLKYSDGYFADYTYNDAYKFLLNANLNTADFELLQLYLSHIFCYFQYIEKDKLNVLIDKYSKLDDSLMKQEILQILFKAKEEHFIPEN